MMTDDGAETAAAATRDVLLRVEGPVHPEDLACVRHGTQGILRRRRGRDRASLHEGLLRSHLEAVRDLKRYCNASGVSTGGNAPLRQRALDLRRRALGHCLAMD